MELGAFTRLSREVLVGIIAGLAITFLTYAYARLNEEDIKIDGYWSGSIFESGKEIPVVLQFMNTSGSIKGTMIKNIGSAVKPKHIKSALKAFVKGNVVKFETSDVGNGASTLRTEFAGRFADGIIKGRWNAPDNSGSFSLIKEE